MPRVARLAPGGYIYHVLNRGVGRMRLFEKPADYAAFERIMARTMDLRPMRLLAYCLMPNHWHLILWPQLDGQLASFMQRLTVSHVRCWQEHFQVVGDGHVYQGRYKSFPVQEDDHFLAVCRYVERNALRANLCQRAEDWRWASLWRRHNPGVTQDIPPLTEWPVDPPWNWTQTVQEPQSLAEYKAMQHCIRHDRPFGTGTWLQKTLQTLGLPTHLRPPGRPKKQNASNAFN